MRLGFKGTVCHAGCLKERRGWKEERGQTKDGVGAEEDGDYMPALALHTR